jgi:hypothetical protein
MRSGSAGGADDAGSVSIATGVRAGSAANRPRGPITVEPIDPAPGASPGAPSGSGEPPADVGAIAAAKPSRALSNSDPPRTAPPHDPMPSAPAPPAIKQAPRELQTDDIPRLYAAGHYDKVIAQCAGPVSAEHAPVCFLAACQTRNEAAARRFITAVPATRRDQLTTSCKQIGVDILQPDCEADPMACQH